MHVCLAHWRADHEAILAIRRAVFIEEQKVDENLEIDGKDPDCSHVLLYSGHNKAVGTARLTGDGQIGRMAVLVPFRRLGGGSLMLRSLMSHAADSGFDAVWLNAQESAIPFYEKHGFISEGEPFEEAGITHVRMTRSLSEYAA